MISARLNLTYIFLGRENVIQAKIDKMMFEEKITFPPDYVEIEEPELDLADDNDKMANFETLG